MTTSRSIGSEVPARALLALVAALCALLAGARTADAGRKRVVILEFTGPKAAQFREGVEKLVKKSHSVVPVARWESTADDLGATRLNERDVKKVARKLSIDGVISGKVEKRGSRYLVHLQLRDGATGKTVAAPDLVERAAKIGPDGRDTIKQELLPAIDDLTAAGDDEEEDEAEEDDDRPSMGKRGKAKAKAKAKARDEEDEDAAEDEEEDAPRTARGKAKGKAKGKPRPREDEAADDEDAGPRFGKGRSAPRDDDDDDDDRGGDDDDRVAAADDDARGRGDDDDDARLEGELDTRGPRDPRVRPIDLAVGLSFTGRRLSFQSSQADPPQGYEGNPVPGIYVALEAFPLGLDRRKRGLASRIGVQLAFDRVISIKSELEKNDVVYELPTTEQHLAAGLVYRHLLGARLELDASIRFNKRTFTIDRSNPALMAGDVKIPDTSYAYLDPGLALGYVLSPTLMVGGGARFLIVSSTGQMQQTDQYGAASVLGIDVEAGADYRLSSKLLVRGALRLTTLGFTFDGDGALATMEMVSGARDTYFGGFASGVYLF